MEELDQNNEKEITDTEKCAGNHTRDELGIRRLSDICQLCGCIKVDDDDCFNKDKSSKELDIKELLNIGN